jgi:hypothetical protein
MEDYEKEYDLLKKKYSLPDFDKIEEEFEIIESIASARYKPPYVLRFIRRSIVNLFWKWIDYMHSMIYPNPQSAILLKEAEFYTDEEKKKIHDVINILVILARQSTMLELYKSEQKAAEFIKDTYNKWMDIKPTIEPLVTKSIKSWQEELNK